VQVPARFPEGLIHALWHRLGNEDWHFHEISRDSLDRQRPLEFLYQHFIDDTVFSGVRTIGTLVREQALAGSLIGIEFDAIDSWELWKEFLQNYQHAQKSVPQGRRSLFIVILQPPANELLPAEDACLAVHKWDGYVSRLDIAMLSDQVLGASVPHGILRDLTVSCISHLALWDPALVEFLAQFDLAELFDPIPLLKKCCSEREWLLGTDRLSLCWANGSVGQWGGRDAIHSAALYAIGHRRTLDKRLWSGQAAVLLPFVEEIRVQLIEDLQDRIRMPFNAGNDSIVRDVWDLELGHLVYMYRTGSLRLDRATARVISVLRDVRNHLAHFRPIPKELLLSKEFTDLLTSRYYG
jgi:hypothetical protein